MSEFRVLITGSREFSDYETVRLEIGHVLTELMAGHGPSPSMVVVHGAARGADTLAERAAREFRLPTEPHAARWAAPCRGTCPAKSHRRTGRTGDTYCPAAGNYRNEEMVRLGADLVLAFFKAGAANLGTADCVRQAERAGIPVRRITSDG
jgi:hypothetical protein